MYSAHRETIEIFHFLVCCMLVLLCHSSQLCFWLVLWITSFQIVNTSDHLYILSMDQWPQVQLSLHHLLVATGQLVHKTAFSDFSRIFSSTWTLRQMQKRL